MSQKTNPLSLRLQKSNQNFLSPWFSDLFFGESYHRQFEVEEYINKLLKEGQYSKAFFSAKTSYRKSNIFLIIQDVRAQKKKKQLSFNLKENVLFSKPSTLSFLQKVSTNKDDKSTLLRIQEQINSEFLNEKKASKTSFVSFSEKLSQNKVSGEDKILQGKGKNSKTDLLFSFRKKVRNTFLKYKQNYNFDNLFSFEKYLDVFVEKRIFFNNENNLKDLWQTNWKNQIIKNNCFSFCEEIVSNKNLKNKNENISTKVKSVVPLSTTKVVPLHGNPLLEISKGAQPMWVETPLLKRDAQPRDQFIFPTFLPLLEWQKRSIKSKISSCNLTSLFPIRTHFEPIRFISDTQNVISLLDEIISLLEKRVPFRQIKSKLFQNLSKNVQIKGIRISCSGRLGGRSKKAQKSKMQSDQWGETSLNAFSSKVLFARKSAYTSYGKVGIKIWLSFKENVF